MSYKIPTTENQTVTSEFEFFIEDCARCPECVINDEFAVCEDHSDEWNQVFKHHYEIIKNMEVLK